MLNLWSMTMTKAKFFFLNFQIARVDDHRLNPKDILKKNTIFSGLRNLFLALLHRISLYELIQHSILDKLQTNSQTLGFFLFLFLFRNASLQKYLIGIYLRNQTSSFFRLCWYRLNFDKRHQTILRLSSRTNPLVKFFQRIIIVGTLVLTKGIKIFICPESNKCPVLIPYFFADEVYLSHFLISSLLLLLEV